VVVYESKEMLHYSIGLLQLASSRPAEARAAMEQAQVENAAEWFPHRGRAVALVAEGRTQEAVEEYRTALEKAGGNDAMLLFELGEALSAVGQHAEAADQFRKVAQLEPFWADVFVALGNEELQAGRAPEALAAYERYLPLAPRTAATTVAAVQRQIATLKR
jgi:tetratricopeptide (TPR) repeat protein